MSEDSESPTLFGKKKVRVLSFREDWAMPPLMVFALISFIVSVIDFVLIQGLIFQLIWVVIGIPMIVFGTLAKSLPRLSLIKAGFGTPQRRAFTKEGIRNIVRTAYLQISEDQQLVTDGYYSHIRHPIMIGDLTQRYGIAILLSSFYGILFMTIAFVFYLIRIEIEEKMLIEVFGEEYQEYQKRTKKLIPWLY